jgi:hypothetical protein
LLTTPALVEYVDEDDYNPPDEADDSNDDDYSADKGKSKKVKKANITPSKGTKVKKAKTTKPAIGKGDEDPEQVVHASSQADDVATKQSAKVSYPTLDEPETLVPKRDACATFIRDKHFCQMIVHRQKVCLFLSQCAPGEVMILCKRGNYIQNDGTYNLQKGGAMKEIGAEGLVDCNCQICASDAEEVGTDLDPGVLRDGGSKEHLIGYYGKGKLLE